MDQAEAIARLQAAAHQLDETIRVVEGDGGCVEVLRRVREVQSELRDIGDGLLERHLAQCFDAARRDIDGCEGALGGIRDAFCCGNRQ